MVGDWVMSGPVVERLGWMLVHSMWQGVLVAAGLAGVLWVMRAGSARARHGACVVALAALMGLPVGTFWWLGRAGDPVVNAVELAPQAGPLHVAPVRTRAPIRVTVSGSWEPEDRAVWNPLPVVVAAWAVGVLVMGVWQAGGFLWLWWRVRRRTEEADASVIAAVEAMRERLGVQRRVRVRRASWVDVPAVVGVLRPIVLVPVAALNGLSVAQVESLIAHELAHVRRWDALVNLAQNFVRVVMFYHPAAWYVSRRIAEEREHCCDDAAAGACGDRLAYAKALVAMEERRAVGGGGLVLASSGGSLVRRIERVLGRAPAESRRGGGGGAARSLAGVLVAIACVAMPLVAVKSSWAQEKKESTGAPSGQTTGNGTGIAAGATEATAEDLKVDATDYTVQPGDLLSVSIFELTGPGKELVKPARVSDKGNISMPMVGEFAVAGLNELGVEKAVAKAYVSQHLIANPIVSVTVTEARGNTFSVIGAGAEKPGQYAISQPDLRVLDAMAMAGIDAKGGGELYVLRKPQKEGADAKARKIRIPLGQLLAGELKHNVVIRRGDTVIAPGAMAGDDVAQLRKQVEELRQFRDTLVEERHAMNSQLTDALSKLDKLNAAAAAGPRGAAAKVLRIAVGRDGLTLDGQRSDWNGVADALKRLPQPERDRAVLELSVSPELTIEERMKAKRAAEQLVGPEGSVRSGSPGR